MTRNDSFLNVIIIGFILVIVLFYVSQLDFFFSKKFLEREDLLFLITVNQAIFWSSISINALSLKFVRKEMVVEFDYPSRIEAKEGQVNVGKILFENKERYNYYLKLEDLKRHMFVTGKTGSGKSNWFQHFLINYTTSYDTPILLAEFKGEYRYLQGVIPDLLVYKVGETFCINIFDPEGTSSDVHAERIFQIFRSGGLFEGVEYSPQMERVFVDILKMTCKDPVKRSWKGFHEETQKYLRKILKETGDRTIQSSITAIANRTRRYSLGTLKNAFESKVGLSVKEVFSRNVLLDLSSIIKLGGEKEDILFFLNMLFKYLWDKNIEEGSKNYKGIKHITIIEDAQYFASESTTQRSTISSYIEDVALLLRGTGECLISLATRPAVSAEILANCGVFITFQNDIQKSYLQDLLNLNENKTRFLSMLSTGECLMRVNSIGKPFALRAPLMERKWLEDHEIEENNEKILNGKGHEIMNSKGLKKHARTQIQEGLKKIKIILKDFVLKIEQKIHSIKNKKLYEEGNSWADDGRDNNDMQDDDPSNEMELERGDFMNEINSETPEELEHVTLSGESLGNNEEKLNETVELQKWTWKQVKKEENTQKNKKVRKNFRRF